MTTKSAFLQARETLSTGSALASVAIRQEISASWQRCLQSGLDPCGVPEDAAVSDQTLKAARQARERLMRLVRPELELLSAQIAGANFMCAFADETGVVLDTIMDTEFSEGPCGRSIRAGSIWREDQRGTNALGLALLSGRSSMVMGGEHFFGCHGGVSCVAAPIVASDGRIVGLLDASSEVAERQYHTQALVTLAATNIENRLFAEAHRDDYIIQFHQRAEYLATQSVGLIGVDESGRITGANRMSARLLAGAHLATASLFSDLFRGDVQAVLRRLSRGETVQLWDRSNAGFFARLDPGSLQPQVARGWRMQDVPAARRVAPQTGAVVQDDDMARECARVAKRAASLGQAVCIRGQAGTGKTRLAEVVHRHVHGDGPLIAVDCENLRPAAQGMAAVHALLQGYVAPDLFGETGGTLVLENIAGLDDLGTGVFSGLLGTLRHAIAERHWCVLATDRTDADKADLYPKAIEELRMLSVELPVLAARTDFHKIARNMLAELSPDHRLSAKAIKALGDMDRRDNLNDLRHHLQVLAARCPAGVLRDVHVNRFLVTQDAADQACPRCDGTSIRRQRCLEIRRMYRVCQCNVALTARRLGVSRNTVYTHLKD
ncbi:sigma-54-dependent Fis family transcriptional regulator [Antarctobacter heliothermus]|uniref:Transcriptional regulator of acetoin/glycerol metabolism n=1 Tax=Antarctobacter heliothermus TaxID=74033 RepID=A0A239HZE5_9RHOB|nr:GAF domain-containing protein [Antarctobacter heliothermus]SNS86740.1 Transcriptional regulator of acetoin/glycerol metabolism [Antarctobacter heliothermus]